LADRVVFLRPDAERIARAVRTVEAGNRNETPLTFRRPVDVPKKSASLRLAMWTATTNWTVVSVTGVTTTNNTKVIQLAFPLQTQSQGTATITFSVGPTAMCVNHLVRIKRLSNSTTSVITITAFEEGDFWRLAGAEC
jgi:hypothetical protein